MSGGACPNCGSTATGRYCAECGQRQGEETTTLRFWLRRMGEDYFSLDGRVPRSLRLLLLRPGHLSEEWHRGRRARYSNPARLALLGAVVMVAATGVVLPGVSLPTRLLPLVLLAMTPALAALVARMERGSGGTYLEHTVTVLHLQAVYFLFHSVTMLAALDDPPAPGLFETVAGLSYLWTAVYTALALRHVYDESWTPAILKALALHIAWWVLFGVALGLAGAAADAVGAGADGLLAGTWGPARL